MKKRDREVAASLVVRFVCGDEPNVLKDDQVLALIGALVHDLRIKTGVNECRLGELRFQDIPEESPAPAPVPVPPPEPKPAKKPLAPRLRAHGWTQQRHEQAVDALKKFAGVNTGPMINRVLGISESALVHLLRGDRVGKKVIDDVIAVLIEKSAPNDLIQKFRVMLEPAK